MLKNKHALHVKLWSMLPLSNVSIFFVCLVKWKHISGRRGGIFLLKSSCGWDEKERAVCEFTSCFCWAAIQYWSTQPTGPLSVRLPACLLTPDEKMIDRECCWLCCCFLFFPCPRAYKRKIKWNNPKYFFCSALTKVWGHKLSKKKNRRDIQLASCTLGVHIPSYVYISTKALSVFMNGY